MKVRMTALELILHLAEGSTTPNTLQHITKIAREALAEQPAQQPVAWGNFKEDGTLVGLSQHHEDQTNWTGRRPLYTTPTAPAQPWVELTDAEIDECEGLANIRYRKHTASVRGQHLSPADGFLWHCARAIEAKLKEKNT